MQGPHGKGSARELNTQPWRRDITGSAPLLAPEPHSDDLTDDFSEAQKSFNNSDYIQG